MKYIMKAGTLYFNDIVSARIKGAFIGSGKKIYSANDSILMYTDIANLEVPPNEAGNSRRLEHRSYGQFCPRNNMRYFCVLQVY